MTLAQLKRRIAYWQRSLPDLGISHWTIDASIVEAPDGNDGSAACVHSMSDYDHASMEFARAWLRANELKEIDRVIIHELLHIVFRDYDSTIESIHSHLNTPVRAVWSVQIEHELEGVIQRLANALCEAYC